MDKNTLIGLLLMAGVIFGFMYLNRPSEEELQAERERKEQVAEQQRKAQEESARRSMIIDSITPADVADLPALIEMAGVVAEMDDAAQPGYSYSTKDVDLTVNQGVVSGTVRAMGAELTYDQVARSEFPDSLTVQQKQAAVASLRAAIDNAGKYQSFARYLNGEDRTVTLKNNVVSLDISAKGGKISQATLLDYDTYLPDPADEEKIDTASVVLFRPTTADYGFVLTTASQRFNTGEFYFTPEQVNDSTVLMKLDLGGGAMWGLRYTLSADSYVVRMDIVQKNMDRVIPSSVMTANFVWAQRMGRNERGRTFEERNSAIHYKYVGDSPDDLGGMADKHEELNQAVKWIAFKNQFFSSVVIPRTSFSHATIKQTVLKDNPMYLKDMYADASFDYSSTSENPASFDVFLGPNLYPLLNNLDDHIEAEEDLDLTNLVPLGWTLFRWINTIIIIPVFTFLSQFISNYGIIILLLTIFIKIILFPFTYKSYMSQARMRVLAPEIKEINEKYPGKENAMVRQQKTMALYSKAGASPMSGCLPMLLQMPILIAMFTFFPSCIELRGESFLWAKDLAAPDVIFTLPFTIPFYGNHVSLFCLLMTVTNILYTRINMQNQPSQSSMPGMKMMMYLMPVMFLFFFNDYASGLSYYYFLSLLITIIQTYIFRRCVNEEKVRRKMMENAAKPRKKSGFMARLEEAQRKQQAAMREQQKRRR